MTALFAPIERTKGTRKDPTLREMLAAAVLQILELQGDGIPFAHAQQMSADQILSLFQCDHAKHVEAGGDNHPTNLTMRLRKAHRDKTSKIDVPMIRKGDRLAEKEDQHRAKVRAILAPAERPEKSQRSTKGKRAWPKRTLKSGSRFSSRPMRPKSSTDSPKAGGQRK